MLPLAQPPKEGDSTRPESWFSGKRTAVNTCARKTRFSPRRTSRPAHSHAVEIKIPQQNARLITLLVHTKRQTWQENYTEKESSHTMGQRVKSIIARQLGLL